MNILVGSICWQYFSSRNNGARKSVSSSPIVSTFSLAAIGIVKVTSILINIYIHSTILIIIGVGLSLYFDRWLCRQFEDGEKHKYWVNYFTNRNKSNLRFWVFLYYALCASIIISMTILIVFLRG